MNRALEEHVWERGRGHCEYCQFPAEHAEAPFQVDHIVALKHDGETVVGNGCIRPRLQPVENP